MEPLSGGEVWKREVKARRGYVLSGLVAPSCAEEMNSTVLNEFKKGE